MEFDFAIQHPSVRKGQFVQINADEGVIIARVEEIYKTNRYFSRVESVVEYERGNNPIEKAFPVDRWEYLVANCSILGFFNNGKVERLTFPPSPGSKVTEIDETILESFLGFDKRGLWLGKIFHHNLEVRLNLTRLLQKHVAILAMSGAGKSHLVGVIIEELLDRESSLGKPAIIVLDPHGEYKRFLEDSFYRRNTKVFENENIKIGMSDLKLSNFCDFLELSNAQKREFGKILQNMKGEAYEIDDLIKTIDESDIKSPIKENLSGALSGLKSFEIFGKYTRPSIDFLARAGQLSILDLSNFVELKEKQIIASFFAKKLFYERRKGTIPPFLLVIEEAHQFCPEAKKEEALSRGIIETIAREGRKFYASLMLVSQRPIRLSATALSQCNTHIILRVTNPYDIDHIGKSSEGISGELIKALPSLRTGEAVIVGEAVNFPIMIKVRDKKSKKSEIEKTYEEVLVEFNLRNKKEFLDSF
ncbi:MAG: ATP-binding protein [Candidatus Aenigmarchaeota archaeon]|nr:ATP-binding protein [Candidatus Aenigmarchaeota archaeon]